MKTPKPKAEDLIQKLEGIQLSQPDNETLRGRLLSYVDLHEMPAKPTLSTFSLFYSYSRFVVVGTLVVLILVGGTGITFAAQNTLPGQPLYAVKVDITEPLQSALITSPLAKADWQNTLVERRLTEASTLAAQNNLSSTTEAYLGTQIAIHVQASEQDSDTLSAQGEATSSLSTQDDLQAQLDAHTELLSTITSRLAEAGLATSSQQVALLIQNVDAQRAKVTASRQIALATAINDNSPAEFVPKMDTASASTTASTTQSHRRAGSAIAIAFVRAQDTNISTEEASILQKSASLLRLLPNPVVSSTTASSTIAATSTPTQDMSTAASSTDSTNPTPSDSTGSSDVQNTTSAAVPVPQI
jgi:hypothetical protein